jgi:fluoroacetyl-CoA thioesterase
VLEEKKENGGLRPGMEMKKDFTVGRDQTARVVGSGGLDVLATPVLSGWIENVAYEMVDLWLKDDQTTVGGSITTQHIAPTPVGLKVRINVRLEKIEGRKLIFMTEAWDTAQKIAEGEHVRFIVDKQRFMDKVAKKKEN